MDEIALNGVGRIAKERGRQVEVEGWTPEHDAQHKTGQLAAAAAAYANWTMSYPPPDIPPCWPTDWDVKWWKPSLDPIRNLEKAGALIAAEIDRLLALK